MRGIMKKNFKHSMGLIQAMIACLTFLVACGPVSDTLGPPVPAVPQPVVERIGNRLLVSWESGSGDAAYQVYRKAGAEDYVLVSPEEVIPCSWNDTGYPLDIEMRYAIKTVLSGSGSVLSVPSAPITVGSDSLVVEGVAASRFLFAGKVLVTWNELNHDSLDSYVVYRFRGNNPISERRWETMATSIEDAATDANPPADNTLYRYLVVWKSAVSPSECGAAGLPAWGMQGPYADFCEPNDSIEMVPGDGSSLLPETDPAVTYYFETDSLMHRDGDYYRYSFTAGDDFSGLIIVETKLAEGLLSPFLGPSGDRLSIAVIRDGTVIADQTIVTETQEFVFYDFGKMEQGARVDLYLRIRPEIVSGAASLAGAYYLTVKTQL